MVNHLLFENVKTISIYGSVGSIQVDVFKSFIDLAEIDLNPSNLMNFLHQLGIEWTLFLPRNSYVCFELQTRDFWFIHKEYDYPDEDFCLFANWPHKKLVLPVFYSERIHNCTSTFTWLIQNYPFI